MKLDLRRCDGCGMTVDAPLARTWVRMERGTEHLDACCWQCASKVVVDRATVEMLVNAKRTAGNGTLPHA